MLGLGWGVAGVAAATLLSESGKLLAVIVIAAREPPAARAPALARQRATWSRAAMGALFRLNRDLFVRTLLLTAAILMLTRAGAYRGPLVLAANGILYQLFILSALILDGFESAAQVLCGEAVGARDRALFERLVRALLLWGLGFGALISLVYALAGAPLRGELQHRPGGDRDDARLLSLGGAAAGARRHRLCVRRRLYRRDLDAGDAGDDGAPPSPSTALLLLAAGPLGNHGLWLAFTLFLVARAAGQALLLPRPRTANIRIEFGARSLYPGAMHSRPAPSPT